MAKVSIYPKSEGDYLVGEAAEYKDNKPRNWLISDLPRLIGELQLQEEYKTIFNKYENKYKDCSKRMSMLKELRYEIEQ